MSIQERRRPIELFEPLDRLTVVETKVEIHSKELDELKEDLREHISQDSAIIAKLDVTLNNINHSIDTLNTTVGELKTTVADVSAWKTKTMWISVGVVGMFTTLASVIYFIKGLV